MGDDTNMMENSSETGALEKLGTLLSKNSMGSEPVVNFHVKKEMLTGTAMQKADYLYDWAAIYLDDRRYREAEACLLEIEKLDCWSEDETLEPGTYSYLASCYFNMAVKKHVGKKYKENEFEKAVRYAEKACGCDVSSGELANRTLTGARQVKFCIAVLLKDLQAACRIRAEYNLPALTDRQRTFFDAPNNYYVCNEIGEQFIEEEFTGLLKKEVYNDPAVFDDLYELHRRYRSAYEYTEILTYAATFIESNTSRIAILYDDLFEYINLHNRRYSEYFWLMCERLCAVLHSGDSSEIRRVLGKLKKLKDDYPEKFNGLDSMIVDEYSAAKLYALMDLFEFDEAQEFANSLPQFKHTEQILYCISEIKKEHQDYESAERAAASALSLEADVFKIQGLGKLYYEMQQYEKSYDMYCWAIRGLKNDMKKGIKIEGPKYLPSMGRPASVVLRELYADTIDVLIMLDRYRDAGILCDEYAKLPNATEKKRLALRIKHAEEQYLETNLAREQAANANEILTDREEKIRQMIELQNNWYGELIKCQVLDSETEITDDMWDSLDIEAKMDSIIEKINRFVGKSGSGEYETVLAKVNERYPKLSKKSRRYLASAEQIFHVFQENPLIDCAPALVEFARVYEESLWNYIDNTDHYTTAAAEQLKNHPKTLGTAGYIIRNNKGPLRKYEKQIGSITRMRNESAHAYISKEPEVAAIRNMIWAEKETLLDVLSEINGQMKN